MADKEYLLKWVIDPADALKGARQIQTALEALEKVIDRVGPKLKTVGAGVAASVEPAARATQNLATQVGALGTRVDGVARSVSGSGGLSPALGGIVTAGAGLAVVTAAMSSLGDALDRAREYARATAEENLKLRDSLRELRALKGDNATTAETVSGHLDLMLATGAKSDEAKKFDEQFRGAVNNAQKKENAGWKLNDQQTEALKVDALRFAVANNIDPATMGKMLGTLGISEPVTSVDQALGTLGATFQFANEGVGNLTPIYRVAQQLRGFGVRPDGRGGMAKSMNELMAIISVGTVDEGNPLATAKSIKQANRDLSKPAVEKALGLPPQAQLPERLAAVRKYLTGTRAAGRGDFEALAALGAKNGDANLKIVQLADNLDLVTERIGRIAQESDPNRVRGINARFHAENPDRFAEAAVFAARQERGDETRDLATARKFALSGGTKARLVDTEGANVVENVLDANIGGVRLNQFQEPARLRALDSIVSGKILATVPNAAERFPDLKAGLSLTGTPARGNRLAAIIRGLEPGERKVLFNELERFGRDAQPTQKHEAAILKDQLDVLKQIRDQKPAAAGAAPRPQGLGINAPDHGPVRRGQN